MAMLEKARVYQKAGDRHGTLSTLQQLCDQDRHGEAGQWATTQLKRLEPLTGAQMAGLEEEERQLREAKRDRRHQARQRKKEEKASRRQQRAHPDPR